MDERNEEKVVTLPLAVPLDGDTRARLERFAGLLGERQAAKVAANLLRDLLIDEDFWEAALDPNGVEIIH